MLLITFPNRKFCGSDLVLNKKKRDPSSCPVCGVSISLGDLEGHFMQELERLYKLNGTGIAASRKRNIRDPGRPPALPGDSGPEGRWEVKYFSSIFNIQTIPKSTLNMCVSNIRLICIKIRFDEKKTFEPTTQCIFSPHLLKIYVFEIKHF